MIKMKVVKVVSTARHSTNFLEMDDDDEREFSRSLVLGGLEQFTEGLNKIEMCMYVEPYFS
jgi:hypothetical protein